MNDHPMIEVRPSSILGAGNGVFARVDIPRGTTLGHYNGEHLTRAQVLQRYPHGLPVNVLALDSNRYIDGSVNGGLMSMINAPRGTGRRANARILQSARVVTTARIPAGQEVLIGYGSHYWRGRDSHSDEYTLNEILRLPVRVRRSTK